MTDRSLEPDASTAWREQVLEVVLRASTLVVPPILFATVVLRGRANIDFRTVILLALGGVLIALRFFSQLGFRVRAALFLVALESAGISVITQSGFLPGAAMVAVIAVVLCAIFFGRRTMFAVLAIMPIAYVVVGLLVTRGFLTLRSDDADPMAFHNWVRTANSTALLSCLLGIAVEYVIRHVENSYQKASKSAAALQEAYDQLGMLHRRFELAKEEERSFLARELHDEIGQTLTALKLRVQLLLRGGADVGQRDASDLIALVDGLIAHARKISIDLRPALLDELGLAPALRTFLETQARHSGVTMTLDAPDLVARLSPELEHACFRIVQEAVTNALKHAQARSLVVRINLDADRLHLVVQDDGRGLSEQEVAEKTKAGHLGLLGIRERVRMLGGELSLAPTQAGPPPGTCLKVALPNCVLDRPRAV